MAILIVEILAELPRLVHQGPLLAQEIDPFRPHMAPVVLGGGPHGRQAADRGPCGLLNRVLEQPALGIPVIRHPAAIIVGPSLHAPGLLGRLQVGALCRPLSEAIVFEGLLSNPRSGRIEGDHLHGSAEGIPFRAAAYRLAVGGHRFLLPATVDIVGALGGDRADEALLLPRHPPFAAPGVIIRPGGDAKDIRMGVLAAQLGLVGERLHAPVDLVYNGGWPRLDMGIQPGVDFPCHDFGSIWIGKVRAARPRQRLLPKIQDQGEPRHIAPNLNCRESGPVSLLPDNPAEVVVVVGRDPEIRLAHPDGGWSHRESRVRRGEARRVGLG